MHGIIATEKGLAGVVLPHFLVEALFSTRFPNNLNRKNSKDLL